MKKVFILALMMVVSNAWAMKYTHCQVVNEGEPFSQETLDAFKRKSRAALSLHDQLMIQRALEDFRSGKYIMKQDCGNGMKKYQHCNELESQLLIDKNGSKLFRVRNATFPDYSLVTVNAYALTTAEKYCLFAAQQARLNNPRNDVYYLLLAHFMFLTKE